VESKVALENNLLVREGPHFQFSITKINDSKFVVPQPNVDLNKLKKKLALLRKIVREVVNFYMLLYYFSMFFKRQNSDI